MTSLKQYVSKAFWLISLSLIALGVYYSLLFVLNGDVIFHTDIARDFMLMQEMVENQKPTLIGPKIGPVPGLFHGPLWLYLNMPAFMLGNGNPVVVGWGWVIMGIIFLYSIYFTTKRIFGTIPALLATVFFASRLAFYSHQLFNPSGAIMLTPVFFYFYWKYFQDYQPKYLIFLSLILGCIIQFEVAYGLPITILVFASVIVNALKNKLFKNILYLFFILIPLSSYILFDLRHDFFQLNSVFDYLRNSQQESYSIISTLKDRWSQIADSSYTAIIPSHISWVKYLYTIFFVVTIFLGIRSDSKSAKPYWLYLYLICGYWFITSFYHGVFESYYYQALQVLSIIILSSSVTKLSSSLSVLMFIPILALNFQHSKVASYATYDYSGNHASSWQYNLQLAEALYSDANSDFGYFILSEDLLAYSPKYAILYARKLHSDKSSYIFEKKPITYVIISSDTYKQGSIDIRWWEEGQVRIAKMPESVIDFRGAYTIKKYLLSEQEVNIPEDPNLMQGISFR